MVTVMVMTVVLIRENGINVDDHENANKKNNVDGTINNDDDYTNMNMNIDENDNNINPIQSNTIQRTNLRRKHQNAETTTVQKPTHQKIKRRKAGQGNA